MRTVIIHQHARVSIIATVFRSSLPFIAAVRRFSQLCSDISCAAVLAVAVRLLIPSMEAYQSAIDYINAVQKAMPHRMDTVVKDQVDLLRSRLRAMELSNESATPILTAWQTDHRLPVQIRRRCLRTS